MAMRVPGTPPLFKVLFMAFMATLPAISLAVSDAMSPPKRVFSVVLLCLTALLSAKTYNNNIKAIYSHEV